MPKQYAPVIDVFIGYDGKESAAAYVLVHSILARASMPVRVTFIRRSTLGNLYTRSIDERASTEFSLSRFLVPYMMDYRGWAIFMDCDMLVTTDITKLWRLRDDKYNVMCVKHDYEPQTAEKMAGEKQYAYPRKNWSSLMLLNCSNLRQLTPAVVNSWTPAQLHRMHWAQGDAKIGELPMAWNWLVGEYPCNEELQPPHNIHWTLGGPWWQQYHGEPWADLWRAEMASMMNENGGPAAGFSVLMQTARTMNALEEQGKAALA